MYAIDRSEFASRQPGNPPVQMAPRCMTCSVAWTCVKAGVALIAFVLNLAYTFHSALGLPGNPAVLPVSVVP
jgi:hypothetical protein